MGRNAADTEYNTCMLNQAVRMVKLGAHASDFGPNDIGDHLIQPVALGYFEIVVQQSHDWSIGMIHREVVYCREIEFSRKL